MTYTQITPHERYALFLFRRQGYTQAAIARALRRHPSTISRELRRNVWREDGRTYRPGKAQSYTNHRRRISRRNAQFTAAEWALVDAVLREDFSPEQVVGWFTRFKILAISHETIYRHIWTDKQRGGSLHVHLRRANKRFRKRYVRTTVGDVSPGSGTSRRDRQGPRTARASGTGKWTPCSATARRAPASSRWSSERRASP